MGKGTRSVVPTRVLSTELIATYGAVPGRCPEQSKHRRDRCGIPVRSDSASQFVKYKFRVEYITNRESWRFRVMASLIWRSNSAQRLRVRRPRRPQSRALQMRSRARVMTIMRLQATCLLRGMVRWRHRRRHSRRIGSDSPRTRKGVRRLRRSRRMLLSVRSARPKRRRSVVSKRQRAFARSTLRRSVVARLRPRMIPR